MSTQTLPRSSLTRFAWLSIAAAVLTIGLKFTAYLLTGSVGLILGCSRIHRKSGWCDHGIAMLTIAARPADDEHAFGHDKAEYFSSGLEGMLILVAAVSIGITAVMRLIDPKPLEQVGIGLAVSLVASAINLTVALILRKAGKQYDSITLRADSQHLMTDVWTSAGVLIGVGAVVLTGWMRLDPIIALLVAANIIWSGFKIIRSSVLGLMDTGISTEDMQKVRQILDANMLDGIEYHALRTRQSGARRIVSLHVLVPGEWTVQQGHQLLEHIEADLHAEIKNATIFTHLESLSDPTSWDDTDLIREKPASPNPIHDHPMTHLR